MIQIFMDTFIKIERICVLILHRPRFKSTIIVNNECYVQYVRYEKNTFQRSNASPIIVSTQTGHWHGHGKMFPITEYDYYFYWWSQFYQYKTHA